jgi:hypothetical protein
MRVPMITCVVPTACARLARQGRREKPAGETGRHRRHCMHLPGTSGHVLEELEKHVVVPRRVEQAP